MQPEEMTIQQQIVVVRDQRVMLDFELAALYGVETKVLNQAVKRNLERFPADFMFQLTQGEWALISNSLTLLRSQNATANLAENQDTTVLRSQIVTAKTEENTDFEVLQSQIATAKSIKKFSDQNDINEMTQAQLDAISEALAELQAKPQKHQRQRIGFIKDNDKS